MAQYIHARGRAGLGADFAVNTTRYLSLDGQLVAGGSTEADHQTEVRDTYTASNLWLRVVANSISVTTTLRTRKNTANGGQSVSIGASSTGTFEDTSNTDSLSSGDVINYQVTSGAGSGALSTSIISVLLANSTHLTVLEISSGSTPAISAADTVSPISSSIANPESDVNMRRTVRMPTTIRNLRVMVRSNSATPATIRSYKNGSNGAQSVSIGSGSTGEFEDSSNSDTLAAGDTISTLIDLTSGTSLGLGQIQYEATAAHPISAPGSGGGTHTSATNYVAPIGFISSITATESTAQMKVRAANTAAMNLYVYVSANTMGSSGSVDFRVNGSNAISVSIGAGATGVFEETSTRVALSATDLINYRVVAAATSVVLRMMLVDQIPVVTVSVSGVAATATADGLAGTVVIQSIAAIVGIAATANADGYAGTVAAQNDKDIVGVAAVADAAGLAGTVTTTRIAAIVGVAATANADGLAGTVAAVRIVAIAGVVAIANAAGLLGTVVAQNVKAIVGITATATAAGNAGAVLKGRTIPGVVATADAAGLAGTVVAQNIKVITGVAATANAAGNAGTVVAQVTKAIVGVAATANAVANVGAVLISRTVTGIAATATADGLAGTVATQNTKVITGVAATANAAGNAGTVLAQIAKTILGVAAAATADGIAGTVIALLGRLVTHFRFRNDNGSETTATWAQAEDTDHTEGPSTNVRLRIQMDTNVDTGSEGVTLQYDKSGEGAWKDLIS